jgi:hypothetical protein
VQTAPPTITILRFLSSQTLSTFDKRTKSSLTTAWPGHNSRGTTDGVVFSADLATGRSSSAALDIATIKTKLPWSIVIIPSCRKISNLAIIYPRNIDLGPVVKVRLIRCERLAVTLRGSHETLKYPIQ